MEKDAFFIKELRTIVEDSIQSKTQKLL